MAEKVAEMMNALRNTSLVWETSVLQLLESYHITPVSTENLETPEDYLRRCNVYIIQEVYTFISRYRLITISVFYANAASCMHSALIFIIGRFTRLENSTNY